MERDSLGTDFSEQDLQVIAKISVLSQIEGILMFKLPFYKKYSPEFVVKKQIFLPLFQTIELYTSSSYAIIEMHNIFKTVVAQHFVQVQTYLLAQKQIKGVKILIKIEFYQAIVWTKKPNILSIKFPIIKLHKGVLEHSTLRIIISNGSIWVSNNFSDNEGQNQQKLVQLQFQNLFDTVLIQVWEKNRKLGESRCYACELLDDRRSLTRDLSLGSKKIGTIKIKVVESIPMIRLE